MNIRERRRKPRAGEGPCGAKVRALGFEQARYFENARSRPRCSPALWQKQRLRRSAAEGRRSAPGSLRVRPVGRPLRRPLPRSGVLRDSHDQGADKNRQGQPQQNLTRCKERRHKMGKHRLLHLSVRRSGLPTQTFETRESSIARHAGGGRSRRSFARRRSLRPEAVCDRLAIRRRGLHLLDHFHDRQANSGVGDLQERPDQPRALLGIIDF